MLPATVPVSTVIATIMAVVAMAATVVMAVRTVVRNVHHRTPHDHRARIRINIDDARSVAYDRPMVGRSNLTAVISRT